MCNSRLFSFYPAGCQGHDAHNVFSPAFFSRFSYTMCPKLRVYLSFLISIINIASSEYIPINWNLTSEKGNSHLERRYKYPMYNEVAPAVCDLTYNYCDIFCCSDSECHDWQRQTFDCDVTTPKPKPFDNYACGNDNDDKPSWFSFFCFTYENSAYLGKFFVTMPKIQNIKVLKSAVSSKNNVYKFADEYSVSEKKSKQLPDYKFESPLMSYVLSNDSINLSLITPFSIKMNMLMESPSACNSSPIKFKKNKESSCYTSITPEQCENGLYLSISPYLCRDGSKSELENFPFILKNLNSMESVDTDVVIKCASSEYRKRTFNKKKYYYYNAVKETKECNSQFDIFTTKLNGLTCQNVLAKANYYFTVNGSNIIKLQAEFVLMDVVLRNLSGKSESSKDLLYVNQGFNVDFKDIEPENKKNFTEIEGMNRGYLFGENLNFGNIR